MPVVPFDGRSLKLGSNVFVLVGASVVAATDRVSSQGLQYGEVVQVGVVDEGQSDKTERLCLEVGSLLSALIDGMKCLT
jgi:hypothetical protein